MNKNPLFALALGLPLALVTASCATLLDVDFGSAHLSPDASVTGDGGPCQPKSCQTQGFQCGTQTDGCGEALECGTCKTGVCKAGKCACVPKTCPDLGVQCGKVDDGCGAVLDCGACTNASDSCNGQTNKCECKGKTCQSLGAECGLAPDGCGQTLSCGDCNGNVKGPYCTAGKCGAAPCVPKTCQQLGANCGQVSDGCGKVLTCGTTCPGSQTCGGGGQANVCGCTGKTCQQVGASCGSVPDGCGGNLACGNCTSPQTCGGGGVANQCGCTVTGSCPPGSNCGTVPDGCGGNIACGPACVAPNTCGGGGIPNRCGCTPLTCDDFVCGSHTTCGVTINCGSCNCFTGDTPVLMANGASKAISAIQPGELVYAWDPSTGVTAPRAVQRVAIHDASEARKGIVVINGVIHVTPNHPFKVGDRVLSAGELHVGDVLQHATVDGGRVSLHDERVLTLSMEPGGNSTFDVKMLPPAGYFVGSTHTLALPKQ